MWQFFKLPVLWLSTRKPDYIVHDVFISFSQKLMFTEVSFSWFLKLVQRSQLLQIKIRYLLRYLQAHLHSDVFKEKHRRKLWVNPLPVRVLLLSFCPRQSRSCSVRRQDIYGCRCINANWLSKKALSSHCFLNGTAQWYTFSLRLKHSL